jgi:hypothetical protein
MKLLTYSWFDFKASFFRAQDIAHEMPGSYGLLTGREAGRGLLASVSAAHDVIVCLRRAIWVGWKIGGVVS